MSTPLFKDARPTPDCPSELAFDRWQLGELPAKDSAAMDVHRSTCAHCEARATERAALAASISPAARAQMIQRVMQAVPAQKERAPWWRRAFGEWGFVPAFAGAAAVLVAILFLGQGPGPQGELEVLRSKGSVGLSVYRERGGEVELARSGEVMTRGDRLRFGIEVPKEGHVMIVGVEANGSRYVCFPSSGASHSTLVPAGRTEALPGAIELDDSSGRETLHLIYCPEAFALSDLAGLDSARLAQRGCLGTLFEIEKESR